MKLIEFMKHPLKNILIGIQIVGGFMEDYPMAILVFIISYAIIYNLN